VAVDTNGKEHGWRPDRLRQRVEQGGVIALKRIDLPQGTGCRSPRSTRSGTWPDHFKEGDLREERW
jgi:hypothetical protein